MPRLPRHRELPRQGFFTDIIHKTNTKATARSWQGNRALTYSFAPQDRHSPTTQRHRESACDGSWAPTHSFQQPDCGRRRPRRPRVAGLVLAGQLSSRLGRMLRSSCLDRTRGQQASATNRGIVMGLIPQDDRSTDGGWTDSSSQARSQAYRHLSRRLGTSRDQVFQYRIICVINSVEDLRPVCYSGQPRWGR